MDITGREAVLQIGDFKVVLVCLVAWGSTSFISLSPEISTIPHVNINANKECNWVIIVHHSGSASFTSHDVWYN